MQAYVDTTVVFPKTDNVSADFTTNDMLIGPYLGYAVSYVVTNASADLDLTLTIEASACSNGNFATVQGSKQQITDNDIIVYNVSNTYYKWMRVKCDFVAGSCTILMEITRKA